LGDGILNLEFQSKMNTIGDVLQAIKAIDLSEKNIKDWLLEIKQQTLLVQISE
jgi:hypothetical protein